jgi:hypothetical protein
LLFPAAIKAKISVSLLVKRLFSFVSLTGVDLNAARISAVVAASHQEAPAATERRAKIKVSASIPLRQ